MAALGLVICCRAVGWVGLRLWWADGCRKLKCESDLLLSLWANGKAGLAIVSDHGFKMPFQGAWPLLVCVIACMRPSAVMCGISSALHALATFGMGEETMAHGLMSFYVL